MKWPFLFFQHSIQKERITYIRNKFQVMIQRVQSIYLALVIIALITLTLGSNVFFYNIQQEDVIDLTLSVNVFGSQADATFGEQFDEAQNQNIASLLQIKNKMNQVKRQPVVSFPYYLFSIFLTLLAVATLLSFKKLATQQKIARLNFVLNLVAFIFVLLIYYLGKNQASGFAIDGAELKARLGLGFYCLVASTAFSFLALIGIKRDLQLIKSIDRIR